VGGGILSEHVIEGVIEGGDAYSGRTFTGRALILGMPEYGS
jgi:hypothetical protein